MVLLWLIKVFKKNDLTYVASTALEAKNAQSAEEIYRLSFGDGLQLEVRLTGTKVWIYRYQKPTTKKYMVLTIGKYPALSLKNAKKLLHDAKDKIGKVLTRMPISSAKKHRGLIKVRLSKRLR